jgi:hypothetical protein
MSWYRRDVLAAVRRLALVMLLVGIAAGSAFDLPAGVGHVAVAKDKGGGHGNSSDQGKGNKGDKEGKNEKPKKDKPPKKGKKGKQNEGAPEPVQVVVVQPAAGYRVTVGCYADEAAGRSTCVFAGVATADGDSVDGLAVSEGTVCASVLAGDFVQSDGAVPRDSAGLSSDASGAGWYAVGTGYRGPAFVSQAQPDVVTLVLAGTVTTEGTATYWLRTANGVQAAAGPGLHCESAAATGAGAEAMGAVVVQAFACPFAAVSDQATVDWFARCVQPVDRATFKLTALDGENPGWQRSETVNADGVLRADDLAPGHYQLVQLGADWCHAESDRVDDRGDVIVTAGERTSVWIFDCTESGDASPPSGS